MGDGLSDDQAMYPLVMVFILGVIVLVAFLLCLRCFRVTALDVRWLAGTDDVTEGERAVYVTYLRRSRLWRFWGGAWGVAFAIVTGVVWFGNVTIGIGGGSPLADVLTCGLVGVVAGALLAETPRMRAQRSLRAASLAPEAHPRCSRPDVRWAARVILLLAVVLAILECVTRQDWGPVLIVVAGAILAAIAELTQRAITGQARPVLSERAARVDRRLRGFASAKVAWLQLAAAILTLGWSWSFFPVSLTGPNVVWPVVVALVQLVAVLLCLHRAAAWPPFKYRLGAATTFSPEAAMR